MSLRNLLPTLALALATASFAQPTWRFHLAFEDGTGAKDTIWMVYDTTVTQTQSQWPVDLTQYAQSQGELNYEDGNFHVFTINDLIDSTNSIAFPYSWFPIFDGTIIDAINWIPPMTIRWDTSLFHAPYLPYDQGSFGTAIMDGLAFSAYSNHPELGFGVYDMLIDDSVTVDFLWDFLFQFGVYFSGDGSTIDITDPNLSERLHVWPNPADRSIHIPCCGADQRMTVFDQLGRSVLSEMHSDHSTNDTWDISSLRPGTYYLTITSPTKTVRRATFQKME